MAPDVIARAWHLLRTNPLVFGRRLRFVVRHPVFAFEAYVRPDRSVAVQASYEEWLRSRRSDRTAWEVTGTGPCISVLMPVYNTPERLLRAAIESVLAQTYSRWELCIADDASTEPRVRIVLDEYRRRDGRVKVVHRADQGHISAASNDALALASGEFVALLDHDDVLSSDALAQVARVAATRPNVDLVYSDEDKLDESGRRTEPFFKPAWSPTLLHSCNYITHLAVMRRSIVLEVGGFRDEVVGSQDHDLFLRVGERARETAHIPLVLYSWRKTETSTAAASTAKPYAMDASRRAVTDALRREGEPNAAVEPTHLNGIFFVRRPAPAVSVSLVVLGSGADWRRALDAAKPGQVVDALVMTGSGRPSVRGPDNLRRVSALSDLRGDVMVLLDSWARPGDDMALAALLEEVQRREVAVVGGRTRRAWSDRLLQAGVIIGDRGQPEYAYAGMSPVPSRNFYLNLKDLSREVSAVHVGCCAVRRDTWQEMGGWRDDLPQGLAMADLCLRAVGHGYGTVYTPRALFVSRVPLPPMPRVDGYDWAWRDFSDPFWNPNLTPSTPDGLPFRPGGSREARVRPCGLSDLPDSAST